MKMIKLLIFYTVLTVTFSKESINNRCSNLNEYKDFINCSFNPDDFLDVPQIIKRHGYPAETHTVQTEDGYLLGIHRISGSKDGKQGGQPVLLQHGMLGSSVDFVINGNNSLGFFLADQGYDVWLGNCRGNTYSKAHISLPTWSAQFWNFSWHEMGTYDLPAVLYYISNTTGKLGEIIYIGHSMGTTQFFVLAATKPQVAKNVKLMVAFAPTVYMTHLRSPIRYLAPFVDDLNWVERYLGLNQLLPHSKVFDLIAFECRKNATKKICENWLFVVGGFERREFNLNILPTVIAHNPAGTSIKTALHYIQEIKSGGKFQKYDYGTQGNLIEYGTPTPPEYTLTNIKRPIYLMYAEKDNLTSYIDVVRLSRQLSGLVGLYKVPLDFFSHIDFIYGKDAYQLVYQPLLKVLKNFTEY